MCYKLKVDAEVRHASWQPALTCWRRWRCRRSMWRRRSSTVLSSSTLVRLSFCTRSCSMPICSTFRCRHFCAARRLRSRLRSCLRVSGRLASATHGTVCGSSFGLQTLSGMNDGWWKAPPPPPIVVVNTPPLPPKGAALNGAYDGWWIGWREDEDADVNDVDVAGMRSPRRRVGTLTSPSISSSSASFASTTSGTTGFISVSIGSWIDAALVTDVASKPAWLLAGRRSSSGSVLRDSSLGNHLSKFGVLSCCSKSNIWYWSTVERGFIFWADSSYKVTGRSQSIRAAQTGDQIRARRRQLRTSKSNQQ